ncbi:MAG: hypothetical protein NTY64_15945, partial [Deltaproteobacteria bacterium]|nr:hypothetical protein [Deltaproteobacteria bacterium]
MNRHRYITIFLFTFMALGVFFIPGPVQAQKVTIAQGVDADTLDPNAVFTISAQVVYSNIFDPLFT